MTPDRLQPARIAPQGWGAQGWEPRLGAPRMRAQLGRRPAVVESGGSSNRRRRRALPERGGWHRLQIRVHFGRLGLEFLGHAEQAARDLEVPQNFASQARSQLGDGNTRRWSWPCFAPFFRPASGGNTSGQRRGFGAVPSSANMPVAPRCRDRRYLHPRMRRCGAGRGQIALGRRAISLLSTVK